MSPAIVKMVQGPGCRMLDEGMKAAQGRIWIYHHNQAAL